MTGTRKRDGGSICSLTLFTFYQEKILYLLLRKTQIDINILILKEILLKIKYLKF